MCRGGVSVPDEYCGPACCIVRVLWGPSSATFCNGSDSVRTLDCPATHQRSNNEVGSVQASRMI